MIIKRFGTDLRSKTAESILSKTLKTAEGRLFLFPIPTTSDGVRIKGSDRALSDEIAALKENDIVAGYGLPSDLTEKTAKKCRIIDVMRDEIFTGENAKLTALGALGVLLTEQRRSPADLSVGVIGYGRIGKELVRLLLFFGAKVFVYSESKEKREELCSYGIGCKESVIGEACGRFQGLDVLFNTAPASLILPEEAKELDGVTVYELASGDNLPPEVAGQKLPSLPEKMYPVSAGKRYAQSILRMLRNQ